MLQAGLTIDFCYVSSALPSFHDLLIMFFHAFYGCSADVFFGAERALDHASLGVCLDLIEVFVILEDLLAQLARLGCVLHHVLHADLPHVLWAEVVPVNIGDVEETDTGLLLFRLCLLLHFSLDLFDLLAGKERPLLLHKLVPLGLAHAFHHAGLASEHILDLLSFAGLRPDGQSVHLLSEQLRLLLLLLGGRFVYFECRLLNRFFAFITGDSY